MASMSNTSINLPLLISFLLFVSFPVFIVAATLQHDEEYYSSHEAFRRCFLYSTNSSAAAADSDLFYTFNSSSYYAVFRSTVQNPRFLSMPHTTMPTSIVTPTHPSHVQAAVECGRRHRLHVRVRSGGHDFEGLSYTSRGDPFFTLDLRNFRNVDVNTSDNTAWVGAGATLGEVYNSIAAKSAILGFPAGVCPSVGVGGHVSGGGFGTLLRKYGTAADQVVDAVVVDVDGRILDRESMGEDLFWAIRGGGGASFGIILSFKVRLVPVTPTVTVFTINRTLEQGAAELVEKWQHVAPNLDDSVFLLAYVEAIDDPKFRGNRTIMVTFRCLFLGERDELLFILDKAFPELGVEAGDCSEMSWIESTVYYGGVVSGPSKAKSDFVREPISPAGWKNLFRFLMRSRDEPMVMVMNPWKGRMEEIEEEAIPFPHRSGNLFGIQYVVEWEEPEEEEEEAVKTTQRHLRWMRELYAFMAPYASKNPRAAYINYKDIDLGRNEGAAWKTSYEKSKAWAKHYFLGNLERLAKVKAQVDPTNYFWNELSIPPY